MASKTLSKEKSTGIFNAGDIFNSLGNTVLKTLDQVAPVWLQQQLDLDRRIPIAQNPTFSGQPSATAQNTRGEPLTTQTGNAANPSVTVSQRNLVLGAIALGLVGILILDRKRG